MMSADEFEAWRARMGISRRGAAAALHVTEEQVRGFADWSIVIPDSVEEECNWMLVEAKPAAGILRERTDALRGRIFALYPDFEGHFDDAMAYGIGRMFTPHGMMSEFSTYYIRHITAFDSPQLAAFFQDIETIYAADPNDRDGLANAIATCFLENISCTQAGEAGRHLMGPASLRFFMFWHAAYG